MAISLPKTLRASLLSEIAQGFSETTVEHGTFLSLPSRMWRLHELAHKGSATAQALEICLGEQHISTFVTSEVWKRTLGDWEPDAPPEPFEEKFGKATPSEWAESLVAGLESLPWRYTAYAPFPGDIPVDLLEDALHSLTPTITLVPGQVLASTIPERANGLRDLLENNGFQWQAHLIYTRIEFEGYIPRRGDSESAHQLMHLTLSLYGIALALGLLIQDPWRNRTRTSPFYAHYIFRSESQTASHVTNLGFDPSYVKILEELGNFTAARPSETPAPLYIKTAEIGKVLAKASPRLLNAARWYFDSHCGSSDQVRFVQICTALEVLLGDEKQGREAGLAALMANRCAYFLGRSDQERKKINEGFRDGYDIRSKIVHAGKNKLSGTDKAHFYYMQQLCASIIKKECGEVT